jgi:hypothetical protein
MSIYGNKYADKAAKKETKLKKINLKKYVSLVFIKKKIKEFFLNKWQLKHAEIKKGKYYN